MTQSVSAVTALTKHPSESVLYAIDFTELLGSSETLSGTPTVTGSPSGLTIGTPAVNTGTVVDDEGNTIAVGKAVQVRVSGGGAEVYLTAASLVNATTTKIDVDAGDHTVASADVGKYLNITGGTATAGLYLITAVDTDLNQLTLDASAGSVGNTVVAGLGYQDEDYELTVKCATTASDTRTGVCKLYVRSN